MKIIWHWILKHCYFKLFFFLVKMASKTVIRSIININTADAPKSKGVTIVWLINMIQSRNSQQTLLGCKGSTCYKILVRQNMVFYQGQAIPVTDL